MSSQAQDNLYEHSDGEADAQASENPGGDELMSPADGYFGSHRDGEPTRARYAGGTGPTSGQLPVVPNVMVEDPSLQQGSTAEAKAREAAEEQENRHTTERRSSETPQRLAAAEPTEVEGEEQGVDDDGEDGDAVLASPVSRSTHIPQPLVRRAPPHPNRYHIYSDAPPAYSPSPSRSYGTVAHEPTAPHDAYGEDQPLLTPPSPFPEPDMPQGAWRGFTRSKASWGFRKKATLILVAVVIAILVIVMTIGYLMNSGKQSHDYIEEPVRSPGPQLPYGDLRWHPLPQCNPKSNSIVSLGHAYTFHGFNNLTLLQKYEESTGITGGRPLQTFGEINIRPATGLFYSGGYYEIQTISNGDFGFTLSAGLESGTLKIQTARLVEWEKDMEPCMQMRFTLFVPPGAMLGMLDIQTEHLGIRILEGLSMGVVDQIQMLTYRGDIIAPEKEANDTVAPYRMECPQLMAQSISGQMKGWFPLYDGLIMIARLNNIAVTVGQKLVKSWKNPPAARLTIQSGNGNITLREMEQNYGHAEAGRRDHRVMVESSNGHIHAETIYSSSVEFNSGSGNVNVSVTPAIASDCLKWGYPFCWIKTDVGGQGNTHIKVNAARGEFGSAALGNMSALQSTHASAMGDIVARYPDEWEGTVIASTLEGEMNYTGRGLVMKPWDAINKRLRGKKGDGSSFMTVNSREGHQRFTFGDD